MSNSSLESGIATPANNHFIFVDTENDFNPRLLRWMVERGITSEEEGKSWIQKGLIQINEKPVVQLGQRLEYGDHVTLPEFAFGEVVYIYHKPIGIELEESAAFDFEQFHERYSDDVDHAKRTHRYATHGAKKSNESGICFLCQPDKVASKLPQLSNTPCHLILTVTGNVFENGFEILREQLKDISDPRFAKIIYLTQDKLKLTAYKYQKEKIKTALKQVGLTLVSTKITQVGTFSLGKLIEDEHRLIPRKDWVII